MKAREMRIRHSGKLKGLLDYVAGALVLVQLGWHFFSKRWCMGAVDIFQVSRRYQL